LTTVLRRGLVPSGTRFQHQDIFKEGIMPSRKTLSACLCLLLILALSAPAVAADNDADLAKKTQNPVADLISVPLQNNWDFGIGPTDAMKYTLNIQPVIPVSLSKYENLIIRTIVPVIYQEATTPGGESHSGLGDTTQSFFYSPVQPWNGWIVGAGPVFLYPTGASAFSARKWGAGPTAVALKQESGWTYGILANHIWSFAGPSDRQDVSATFLQPFVSYTTKTYTTMALNTESTYDWVNSQWTVPINIMLNQLLKVGGQPISLQAGYRYYADAPDGGPDWGLRFTVTLLFPK
jgi:hypothetical protein